MTQCNAHDIHMNEPRSSLLRTAVFILIGTIFCGCGPRSQVIQSPPLAELTDEQVRTLLNETIDSGDASSNFYMNFHHQLSQGSAATRQDAAALRAMVEEMIVLNEAEKNRALAKKILERW